MLTQLGVLCEIYEIKEWDMGLHQTGIISSYLNYNISLAIAFLSYALMSVLVTYWSMSNGRYHDDDRVSRPFWSWFRYVAFLQFITTCLGVIFSHNAYISLVEIKFPDPTLALKDDYWNGRYEVS
jgi:hypothetical protein